MTNYQMIIDKFDSKNRCLLKKNMSNDENCVICFDDITEEDQYKTPCNHIFHLACVKKQIKSECALCRGPLPSNIFTNKSSNELGIITIFEVRISSLLDNRNNETDAELSLLLDIIDDLRRGIMNIGSFIEVQLMRQANEERSDTSGTISGIPLINNNEMIRELSELTNTNGTTSTSNITNTASTSSTSNKTKTIQCSGITKKGRQCLHKTKDDSGLCHNHR